MLELVLELEQGRVLKAEHGEGRKPRDPERVFDPLRVSMVREFLERASEQSDYSFKSKMDRLTQGNSWPICLRQAKPWWG
jgi:hypothetical protein